jgi:phage protein D
MTPPTILVRGRAHSALASALITCTVVDNTDGLSRCEATFTNWGTAGRTPDFLFFDPRVLDFGMSFRVDAGGPLFDGRVTALEAGFAEGSPPTLTVLAEDRLQDLRMTRRTRTFTDMSAGDVVRVIADEHGLAAQVDIAGFHHAALVQANQSDLAFLRELARAIDAETWIEGSTVRLAARGHRDAGVVALDYPTTLLECVATADLAHQRTSVEVTGWDGAAKAALRHEATATVLAEELQGGSSGVTILASTLGERKDVVVHTVPQSMEEVRARAEAMFKALARRFVAVQGAAQAGSDLRVGSYVNLGGLGTRFSGQYYVTGVRHTFDRVRGRRTEFTAESATLAQSATSTGTPTRRARAVQARSKAATASTTRQSPSHPPSAASRGTSRRRRGNTRRG